MIIEKTLGNIDDMSADGRRKIRIILEREDLNRAHQKVRDEEGDVFAVSLPHGERLGPGDVVFADEERIVYVELAPEDVIVIRPADARQWARAAYNIGNMHQPAFLQEDCILTPYDPVMGSVIDRLGIRWERKTMALEGEGANISRDRGHHHTHEERL